MAVRAAELSEIQTAPRVGFFATQEEILMTNEIKDAFYRGKRDVDATVRLLLAAAGYQNPEIEHMTAECVVQWLLTLLNGK